MVLMGHTLIATWVNIKIFPVKTCKDMLLTWFQMNGNVSIKKFWSQISFHHHFQIFVSMLLEWFPSCTTIRAIQASLISRNMSSHWLMLVLGAISTSSNIVIWCYSFCNLYWAILFHGSSNYFNTLVYYINLHLELNQKCSTYFPFVYWCSILNWNYRHCIYTFIISQLTDYIIKVSSKLSWFLELAHTKKQKQKKKTMKIMVKVRFAMFLSKAWYIHIRIHLEGGNQC